MSITIKAIDILKEEIAEGKFKFTIRKLMVGGRSPQHYEMHKRPYYNEVQAVCEGNSYASIQRLPKPQIVECEI